MADHQNMPAQFTEQNLKILLKNNLVSIAKSIKDFDPNFDTSGIKADLINRICAFCCRAYYEGRNVQELVAIIRREHAAFRQTRGLSNYTTIRLPPPPIQQVLPTNGHTQMAALARNAIRGQTYRVDAPGTNGGEAAGPARFTGESRRIFANAAGTGSVVRTPARTVSYTPAPYMANSANTAHNLNATNLPHAMEQFTKTQFESFKKSIFYNIRLQFLPYKICPASYAQTSTIMELVIKESDLEFLNGPRTDKKIPGIKLFCVPVQELRGLREGGKDQVCVKFPETCELRINGRAINVSLRGKKQRSGTTRPPDIHPHIEIKMDARNKIELVHLKTNEEYLLIAQAVYIEPIDQIVENIVANKSVSASDIKKKLFSGCDEDDLVATVELSLKCPLGFSRITRPFRSIHCTHAQCFDGHIFLQMNEQMETWECPICQRIMDPFKDLIHDEFFLSILDNTSLDTESVLMESDGSWRHKGSHSDYIKQSDSPKCQENVVELLNSSCEQSPAPTEFIDLTYSDDEPVQEPSRLVGGPAQTNLYDLAPVPFLTNSLPSNSHLPSVLPEHPLLLPMPSYHLPTPYDEQMTLPPPSFGVYPANLFKNFGQNQFK